MSGGPPPQATSRDVTIKSSQAAEGPPTSAYPFDPAVTGGALSAYVDSGGLNAEPGTYTITYYQPWHGSTLVAQSTVHVIPDPPSVGFLLTGAAGGEFVNGLPVTAIIGFYVGGGASASMGSTISVNWGDGTIENATIVGPNQALFLPASYQLVDNIGATASVGYGSSGYQAVDSHAYSKTGGYSVTVTVVDSTGSATATSQTVWTSVPMPVLAASVSGSPQSVHATEGVPWSGEIASATIPTFSGTYPYSEQSGGNPPFSYSFAIDWGDGTRPDAGGASGYPASASEANTISGQHTFNISGTYTISVLTEITQREGMLVSPCGAVFTLTATVDPVHLIPVIPPATPTATGYTAPPTLTLTASDLSGTAGATFSGVLGTVDDPASSGSPNFTAAIDWGDGYLGTCNIVGSGGVYQIQGAHTYPSPGTYRTTIRVARMGGGGSFGVESSLPPTYSFAGPGALALYAANATATIAASSTMNAPLSVTVNPIGAKAGVASSFTQLGTLRDANPAHPATCHVVTISWGGWDHLGRQPDDRSGRCPQHLRLAHLRSRRFLRGFH